MKRRFTRYAALRLPDDPNTQEEAQGGHSDVMKQVRQAKPGTLEYFNDPANFLAEIKPLDLAFYKKHLALANYHDMKRRGGVVVRVYKRINTGRVDWVYRDWEVRYQEELIRPDSPFKYFNYYDEEGRIKFKDIAFYESSFDARYKYTDGKFVRETPADFIPVIPLEVVRANILNGSGIDIYNTSQVRKAVPIGEHPHMPYHVPAGY